MKTNRTNLIYLLLSLLTLLAGYAYLRYAYKVTDSTPFTQEIVLIILGTVATIFITALLLNKQTEVEIEKEQNIRFLDLKMQTYQELLNLIEEMSVVDTFEKNKLIKLEFVTHKLAVIASPKVLAEYQNFLSLIRKISADHTFNDDMSQLHTALGSLTMTIREDILNEEEHQEFTRASINKLIEKNSTVHLS